MNYTGKISHAQIIRWYCIDVYNIDALADYSHNGINMNYRRIEMLRRKYLYGDHHYRTEKLITKLLLAVLIVSIVTLLFCSCAKRNYPSDSGKGSKKLHNTVIRHPKQQPHLKINLPL